MGITQGTAYIEASSVSSDSSHRFFITLEAPSSDINLLLPPAWKIKRNLPTGKQQTASREVNVLVRVNLSANWKIAMLRWSGLPNFPFNTHKWLLTPLFVSIGGVIGTGAPSSWITLSPFLIFYPRIIPGHRNFPSQWWTSWCGQCSSLSVLNH